MPVFGELIKQHRLRLKYSAEGLGRVTGLSRSGIVNIEKLDEPRVQEVTLHALAKGLELSVDGLLGEYAEAKAAALGKVPAIAVAGVDLPEEVARAASKLAKDRGQDLRTWVESALRSAIEKATPRRR